MKKTWKNFAVKIVVTWFGCGYAPIAPGTAGSIGALPLCAIASFFLSTQGKILFAIAFTIVAILASVQECFLHEKIRDPGYIVIDEVAGMIWASLGISGPWQMNLFAFFSAFLFFRIFDVLKPFPARTFDRASKSSPSAFRRGAHIVLDDVFAGIYACAVTAFLIHYFFH